jgi:hypothetical protein
MVIFAKTLGQKDYKNIKQSSGMARKGLRLKPELVLQFKSSICG